MSEESVTHLPVTPAVAHPAEAAAAPAGSSPPPATSVSPSPVPAAESAAAPAVPAAPLDPTRFVHEKLLEGKVIEVLKQVFDPEIPVNIYELGLIYGIKVNPDDSVHVQMTLTAPACPVAGSLPGDVENKINAIPEVTAAKVELVWEPPWTRERMSENAMLTLGFI